MRARWIRTSPIGQGLGCGGCRYRGRAALDIGGPQEQTRRSGLVLVWDGPKPGSEGLLLAQQGQYTLRDLVGLRHHGGAGLLQDLGA